MKLTLSAITSNQGVERGIRENYAKVDGLSDRISLLKLASGYRFLMVSLLDKPADHFEDVSSKKSILHLEVGYDEDVFSFPLDHCRILRHLGERFCFAVVRSMLPREDQHLLNREIKKWV